MFHPEKQRTILPPQSTAAIVFCDQSRPMLRGSCAAQKSLSIIRSMPQKKKIVESPRKPNPVLGWIAAIAVIAAVGVFILTRPASNAPPQPSPSPVAAQQRQPAAPQPQPPQPAPVVSQPAPVVSQPQAEPPHPAEPPHTHATQPAPQTAPPTITTPSPVSAQKEPDYRMPAYFEDPAAAEPLAPTLDPATVQPHARAAYEVAQKKPRLLAQLPCFCYCDRFGHKSLHDCYASNHAEECDVCMREALEADQMDSQGMTPQEIRAAIIAAHHPRS